MREILFRGRTTKDKEWVYGDLLHDGYDYDVAIWEKEHKLVTEVSIETVGQFIGLDKNGKKIFEGDVVHVLGNQQVEDWKNVDYIGSIAFLDAGFCVIDGTIEDHAFRRYQLPRLDFDLKVIGNIHDNPELLEVE